jgi:Ca2+/Na+ antiporter
MCPAIPWLLNIIVTMSVDATINTSFGFLITVGVYSILVLLFMVIAIFMKFKLRSNEGVKMGVLYVLFIITSLGLIGSLQ